MSAGKGQAVECRIDRLARERISDFLLFFSSGTSPAVAKA
jgi:hypothetical protein